MKIIVGLGNPGGEYAGTRHNVGFAAAERFAETHAFGAWRGKFHSLASEGRFAGLPVLLLKPQTYMNESGRAVRAAAEWCRAEPGDIMIVLDDFHLAVGRLRVRGEGRAAGHHGLESVVAHLSTEAVPRLRIGIGGEADARYGRNYVLSRFSTAERPLVEAAVRHAAGALEVWLKFGLERCQNEFNSDPAATNREEADA